MCPPTCVTGPGALAGSLGRSPSPVGFQHPVNARPADAERLGDGASPHALRRRNSRADEGPAFLRGPACPTLSRYRRCSRREKLKTHTLPRNNLLDTGRGITTAFDAWGTGKMEYVTAAGTPKEYSRKHLRPCRSLRLNWLP
jgi:hypothetical protein